jgi:leucyl aminopeptidase
MKITITETSMPRRGALLVAALAGSELTATAASVDKRSGGALTRAIKASRFKGGKGEMLEVMAPTGVGASRVLLAGLGKPEEVDGLVLEGVGGSAVGRLATSGESALTLACDAIKGAKVNAAEGAARLAYGARLGSYRFDRYRTKQKPEQKPSLKTVTVTVRGAAAAKKIFRRLDKVAEGVFFTRDLVTEPANVINPETLASEARGLTKLGVAVEVLGEARMRKLGMGALLAVGQGSANPSKLVVMRWRGAPKRARAKPVAFVGKGVTFDTGGISLKPAGGMQEMKFDMGGAGTVIGLMRALAGRRARVDAVGIVGLVENMPSATAQRPGDVVTSMSGQTIEVINTDAEGRLVLADALWYAQQRFKPQMVINLATLTGAIIVALGHNHAGLFSNNDELAERLSAAGKAEDELVWRLPLSEAYDKDINSDIADMQNVGANRAGGSITAAQFLQRYIKDVPWAHLDIAGTAWTKKAKPTVPKGATAFGVRLLDRLVADYYEAK